MWRMSSGSKMPAAGQCPRIDTLELKVQIERKIGQQKAEKYFNLLTRFLNLKISNSEFNHHCVGLVGRENICLHNRLIQAIIRNACVSKSPPEKYCKIGSSLNGKVPNGYQTSSLQSLCRDVFTQSPRKGRTPTLRDRKFRDRPSPLGPHGKSHNVVCEDSLPKGQEQQSATELLSLGSRPPVEVTSVEEGEEVEQAAGSPGIYSRSPVKAPLGISVNTKGTKKVLSGIPSFQPESCLTAGVLPDMNSLNKRLDQKLEAEGLKASTDCMNLLNNGLDVFLKRLIRSSIELSASKSETKLFHPVDHHGVSVVNGRMPVKHMQKLRGSFPVSLLDFRVAMELNPRLLGEDWPLQLEKVCLRAFEGCDSH